MYEKFPPCLRGKFPLSERELYLVWKGPAMIFQGITIFTSSPKVIKIDYSIVRNPHVRTPLWIRYLQLVVYRLGILIFTLRSERRPREGDVVLRS